MWPTFLLSLLLVLSVESQTSGKPRSTSTTEATDDSSDSDVSQLNTIFRFVIVKSKNPQTTECKNQFTTRIYNL